MKIAVSAEGNTPGSAVSEKFGRALYFMIFDTEDSKFTAVPNSAVSAQGGAGPEAVRQIVSCGAGVLLTGRLGPNAESAAAAAGIKTVTGTSGSKTVKQAVDEYIG